MYQTFFFLSNVDDARVWKLDQEAPAISLIVF